MTHQTPEITWFRTVSKFFTRGPCSTTLMSLLNSAYGHPMEPEEKAATPLAGGVVQHGYQCGMLWGASLAAGAQAYRLYGAGGRAEAAAIFASLQLVEAFRARNKNIDCLELTDTDWTKGLQMITYMLKGGALACVDMATHFAPEALEVINTALEAFQYEATAAPVSCAAMVAREMGASDEHVIMAAGLAGGIGLSGGACGALGAALWLLAMGHPEEPSFSRTRGSRFDLLIEEFLKPADHEFECSRIVGRVFETVEDHARFLHHGGCAPILEELVMAANMAHCHQSEQKSA